MLCSLAIHCPLTASATDVVHVLGEQSTPPDAIISPEDGSTECSGRFLLGLALSDKSLCVFVIVIHCAYVRNTYYRVTQLRNGNTCMSKLLCHIWVD